MLDSLDRGGVAPPVASSSKLKTSGVSVLCILLTSTPSSSLPSSASAIALGGNSCTNAPSGPASMSESRHPRRVAKQLMVRALAALGPGVISPGVISGRVLPFKLSLRFMLDGLKPLSSSSTETLLSLSASRSFMTLSAEASTLPSFRTLSSTSSMEDLRSPVCIRWSTLLVSSEISSDPSVFSSSATRLPKTRMRSPLSIVLFRVADSRILTPSSASCVNSVTTYDSWSRYR